MRRGAFVHSRQSACVDVIQVQGNSSRRRRDWLAAEEPLEIRLLEAGQPLPGLSVCVTMRTPGHDFELAAGFLLTEGVVPGREAIARMTYCVSPQDGCQQYNIVNVFLRPGCTVDPTRLQRHFYATSSCGVCGKASLAAVQTRVHKVDGGGLCVPAAVICGLPEKLLRAQATFARTGGLHAAALFGAGGQLVAVREDVGRHNAVDKLVGHAALTGLDLRHELLLVSGRTSFEVMQKAAAAGTPVVVAIGAPSSLAVDVAQACDITLVGFLREGRFNVYTRPERIGQGRATK